ncbi:hypothetical protein [Devosia aurantiaca]|uniref:Uncharacterized protein n=1 Tax=Devosia aurantiaca TaxID=2714858 RepID=A0A6M1SAH9_9HYPH|nr:hypothetical protein [Devosia aurantiaca]NGP16959.1 hypothetical protein [Devosia aurantiaca]
MLDQIVPALPIQEIAHHNHAHGVVGIAEEGGAILAHLGPNNDRQSRNGKDGQEPKPVATGEIR